MCVYLFSYCVYDMVLNIFMDDPKYPFNFSTRTKIYMYIFREHLHGYLMEP